MTLSTKTQFIVLGVMATVYAGSMHGELQPMDDAGLSEVSGQAGLTINGDLVMDSTGGGGFDMSLKNPGDDNFLVLNNTIIDLGISNMTLDADGAYTSDFAADGVTPAVVIGLPDRLEVRESQIEAITVAWNEEGIETPGREEIAPASYQLRVGQDENFGFFDAECTFGFCGDGTDYPGYWDTTVTGSGASFNSLTLSRVSGINAQVTPDVPDQTNQANWTWQTSDGPPAENPEEDYFHAAAGTFYTSVLEMDGQGNVNIDVQTTGGGDNNEPNPFVTIIDRGTGNQVFNASGGANNLNTNVALGNPEAQIGNRDILGIRMDGGFSMNGNVAVMPK